MLTAGEPIPVTMLETGDRVWSLDGTYLGEVAGEGIQVDSDRVSVPFVYGIGVFESSDKVHVTNQDHVARD